MKKIFLGISFILLLCGFVLAWDNDNYIDDDFWYEYDSLATQQEKDDLIVYALYGDGDVEIDRTAYTENWTSNTCDTGSIQVVRNISPGNVDDAVFETGNTIYYLQSGKYYANDTIDLQSCSAIISSGGAIIKTETGTPNEVLYINGTQNTIVDNIGVYALSGGNINAIFVDGSNDGSINNVEIYGAVSNFGGFGIFISSSDNYYCNLIHSHNNDYGIVLHSTLKKLLKLVFNNIFDRMRNIKPPNIL